MNNFLKWFKNNKSGVVWGIISPITLYYIVLLFGMTIARIIFGNGTDKYMLCQLIATLVTIPVMYFSCYKRKWWDITGIYSKNEDKVELKEFIPKAAWIFAIILPVSIALNNIILMLPISNTSEGYQVANTNFYSGDVIYTILGAGIFTPILEELVYRGIVYKNIRAVSKAGYSILFSALLFGLIHANIVQFIYAFLIGILLAYFLEREKTILAPILAHMFANLFAIFREKYVNLSFMTDKTLTAWLISFGFLALGIILLWFYSAGSKEANEQKL